MAVNLTFFDYLAILPEILLTALLFIVLGYKSFTKKADGRIGGLITAWGTFIIIVVMGVLVTVFWSEIAAADPRSATLGYNLPYLRWGSMIAADPIGIVFRTMFLLALLLTTLFSMDTPSLRQTEYFALLITATIGFNLMSVSTDFVMLVVALETAGISLYMLAGYTSQNSRSSEAGMKYFVYGAFATALMLYGLSMIYGLTGRTNIYAVADWVRVEILAYNGTPQMPGLSAYILVAAVLIIAGLSYKVSLVPFHWWAPDVYEGAPVPVAGFTSAASKAAGFALFIRIFSAGTLGTPSPDSPWWVILVSMTIITMGLGNLLAIYQTNIKRMLAYSSVAQAGYVMIALLTFTEQAAGAAMFYLLMYVITNIAAFGAVVMVSNITGAEEMEDLYGLSRRAPYLAIAMMLAILSLGGIPPTAGFFGKFFIFKAAVDAGLWWLAMIGILFAFISLYYYLNVLKYIYLYRSDNDDVPVPMSRSAKVGMALSALGILYLGIFAGPAFDWTQNAAQWFFTG